MDRLILDFENGIIEFDTDSQKGTEHYPELKEKKAEILKLLGYETVDFTPAIDAINGFINGKTTEDELNNFLDKFVE